MRLYKIHNILEICKKQEHWSWFCKLFKIDYFYISISSRSSFLFLNYKKFNFQGQHRRLSISKLEFCVGWNGWDYGYPKKLWVDDIRDAPSKDWQIVRSFEQAKAALAANHYHRVSLDHDLGEEDGKDGYGLVKYLVQRKFDGDRLPDYIDIHTANPVGRENMEKTIERYL